MFKKITFILIQLLFLSNISNAVIYEKLIIKGNDKISSEKIKEIINFNKKKKLQY